MGKNGPNKTVAAFRKANPFPARPRPVSAFVEWLAEQARAGRVFDSEEQARMEFMEVVAHRHREG